MVKLFKHHSNLISYTYNYGGDMQGGHTFIKIEKVDDEEALVTTSYAAWHNEEGAVEEYHVPITVLNSIEEIYYKYKMYRFPKLPQSKIFACDAGTGSYSFRFDDKEIVSFSDSKRISPKGYKGLGELRNIIDEAVKSEQLPDN